MTATLTGANRRKLDAIFVRLGGTITPVRRTGELRYHHPAFARPLKVNGHRKGATAFVAMHVRRLLKAA